MNGVIALMGSGEIAPSMVRFYRELLGAHPASRAIYFDTPYGFQENVPQLNEKIETYFRDAFSLRMTRASLLNARSASDLELAEFRATIDGADFAFAGPGSPTYALKNFASASLEAPLGRLLQRGGVVCFSSAAALTLGRFTPPIYEMYKVGDTPHWLEGLNLLASAQLDCVVIPHFDNAEGGNHDTRYCYIGERRFNQLLDLLPPETSVLGIDEHTAAVIDISADTLSVHGKGSAWWIVGDDRRELPSGASITLSELRGRVADRPEEVLTLATEAPSNESLARQLASRALAAGDDAELALMELVEMAERGNPGSIDPSELFDDLLVLRAQVRKDGHFAISDGIRDALSRVGVDIHDSPSGSTWTFREAE